MPSLSSTALHGPCPLIAGKSYSTYAIFIASGLNVRTSFLYSARSEGEAGFFQSGPNISARNSAKSSAFSSATPPPPSPPLIVFLLHRTRIFKPFSSRFTRPPPSPINCPQPHHTHQPLP